MGGIRSEQRADRFQKTVAAQGAHRVGLVVDEAVEGEARLDLGQFPGHGQRLVVLSVERVEREEVAVGGTEGGGRAGRGLARLDGEVRLVAGDADDAVVEIPPVPEGREARDGARMLGDFEGLARLASPSAMTRTWLTSACTSALSAPCSSACWLSVTDSSRSAATSGSSSSMSWMLRISARQAV